MKTRFIVDSLIVLVIALAVVLTGHSEAFETNRMESIATRNIQRFAPVVPKVEYSAFRTGPLEVAKVFGRSSGCENADVDLIQGVSNAAVYAGIQPRLLAAVVAVESGCNPFAVSARSSVGLTQVNVKVWKGKYDFSGRDNPLNPTANLRVGSQILSELIEQHGKRIALQRYLGTGTDDGNITPGGYSTKIMALAGEH